jgi:hypothetical protein
MRFLNKIVFINSATIRYAEVMVDGNVHLIGTQGVGKSTLLRAILFFYNADTLKLGISKEKKNFAEYYFPFQNSFLIYEIEKETGPFCVVAFKSQGKVCFRFFDGAYSRDFFVSSTGHAYEKWEENRKILDEKRIDHTRKIDRYEEYRDILYGNNEAGKKEFEKYALLQSKQYQNIPRTIQNVFLNSKLEAEFIKQTIIMSLNEEDISIDLQSYMHHLKGFENQLNDIYLYKQPHIVKQADTVVKNHLAIRHLESEKNKFSMQLAWSAAQVQRSIPKIVDKKEKQEAEKRTLLEKIEAAELKYRTKVDKIKAEISVLESDIKKAKDKNDYYNRLQIESIIERVSKRNRLDTELQKLSKEKLLLTTQFTEVTTKYDSLLQALSLSTKAAEQEIKEQQLILKEEAASNKEHARLLLEKATADIRQHNIQNIEQARLQIDQVQANLQQEKIRKATVTHQRFFDAELDDAKNTITQYEVALKQNENEKERLKNKIETLQKEVEINEVSIKQTIEREQEKLQQVIATAQTSIDNITENLANSEAALYGWLNTNKPNWENNIGKLLPDTILFNTKLSPTIKDKGSSLFGVELLLDNIPLQVKTLAEYKAELKTAEQKATTAKAQLQKLQADEQKKLEQLRKKYQPQVKDAKDNLKQLEYKHEQDKMLLEQSKFNKNDWEAKAKDAKLAAVSTIDAAMAAASEALLQAQQNLLQIEEEQNKQLKVKEREYSKKNAAIELLLKQGLDQIEEAIKKQKVSDKKEEQELLQQQTLELAGKGADTNKLENIHLQLQDITQELKFIEEHRDKVTEYKKDKNELLDKAEYFKAQKSNLDKQCNVEEDKYKLQKEKITADVKETETLIYQLKLELQQLEENKEAFIRYQQTEAYITLPAAYTEEKDIYKNDRTCKVLIDEINRCYYTAIKRLDELKEAANKFLGNFSTDNIFKFTNSLSDKYSYQQFAEDLNEFINNSKIEEYEKRVNERFANVISLVGKQTGDLMSKAGEIQKVISNINKDFDNKNFVGAIRKIELRTEGSANKVVKLLLQIKVYNDDNIFDIGGLNLFSSIDASAKNKQAVELLKQLSKAIAEYRKDTIALSDSFELQFRIEENQNDTGWVEKLSNVGSEGTDVLVKAMINIMLLNVFKEGASKRFKDFRLHCMMDEIGKLHPNNIKGILQFANDRNILLINGSPTETNALNYKHIYKLEKDEKRNTKVKRIISQLN